MGMVGLAIFRADDWLSSIRRNDQMHESLALVNAIGSWDSCHCPSIPAGASSAFGSSGNLLDRVRAYYYQGRYREIIEIGQKVEDPEDTIPLDYFVGAAYLCLDRGQEVAHFWPDGTVAWDGFRQVAQCLRAHEETRATTLYTFALASEPRIWQGWHGNPAPNQSHYFAAASVARRQNDQDAEEHWLQLAADLYPEIPLVHYRLGEFYERAGNLQRAKESYAQAISRSGGQESSFYIHFIRVSVALEEWDDTGKAIQHLLANPQKDSERYWRFVAGVIRNNPNERLCHYVQSPVTVARPAASGEVQEMIRLIDASCSAN